VPRLLQDALLANGVRPDQIDLIPEEPAAVSHILAMARPGDLLLILADQVSRTWKQVINFRSENAAPVERPSRPVVMAPPVVPELLVGEYAALVRDERGVRLAREPEEED
jgi:cyanophycin synthetase